MRVSTSLGVVLLPLIAFPARPAKGAPSPDPAARQRPDAVAPDPFSSRTLFLERADRLIGRDLSDSSGISIGRVDDLLLNPDGTVAFVVVRATVDGRDDLYPIAWRSLQSYAQPALEPGVARVPAQLSASFTRDRMTSAPAFPGGAWPKAEDEVVFSQADAYWGSGASAHPQAAAIAGKDGLPVETGARRAVRFRASALRGSAVADASGAPIGTLGQAVLDLSGGRLCYTTVILSGGRVLPVPWSVLRPAQDPASPMRLSVAADRLKEAPEFLDGEDRWSSMSDPVWVGRLYSYYSVPAYWKGGPTSAMPGSAFAPANPVKAAGP